jgi:hypothetical protein
MLKQKLHLTYMIPTFSTTNFFNCFLDFVKKDATSHTVVIQKSLKIITYVCFKPPRRYPYFDVVVGLVWSHDPKGYAGASVCYW